MEELRLQEAAGGFVETSSQFFGAPHGRLPAHLARRIETDHSAVMRDLGYLRADAASAAE